MNTLDLIIVVCSSAAVVVAITIAYFIGKLKGFKEVTEKDNKDREEFEQLIVDFVTEKYERKKDE